MKTCLRDLFLLLVLIAGLGLMLSDRVMAQTFTTLHSFTATSASFPGSNSDGANPYGLILSGNTLYGTAGRGGSSGCGTVFKVNPNGMGFTTLHSFNCNTDGTYPERGLILSGNTLYGTAGPASVRSGTIFKVNTDGTGFIIVRNFSALSYRTNSDGAGPVGVILSGDTLYGTANDGGSSGNGTVFALNTNGTGFTTLHSFTATPGPLYTNNDGQYPYAGVILSGNTLYGTAYGGGSSRHGTVFAVNTNGTGFTTLHDFTGSDGYEPIAGVILSGNTLYGTAYGGGSSGYGTIFALKTDGTGFTNLHSFAGGSDGSGPRAGLILSGNTLYGTASESGSGGNGTVFAINTDGTGFTTLHSFTAIPADPPYTNSDGAVPQAELVLTNNTLYGTAAGGGSSGAGTVFSLSFTPQLTIVPSGPNVILTWPTNYAGFDYTGYTLQSTTNLGSSAAWATNSPPPVIVNGQNTVTNPISGTRKFYRLSQ